jgi:hypothetical protein
MMNTDYVKVEVYCDRCRDAVSLCMPVPRNVPEPIACSPGGPSGSVGDGMLRCGICGGCMPLSELRQRVIDETRRGWGQHIRNGAVVIHYRAS